MAPDHAGLHLGEGLAARESGSRSGSAARCVHSGSLRRSESFLPVQSPKSHSSRPGCGADPQPERPWRWVPPSPGCARAATRTPRSTLADARRCAVGHASACGRARRSARCRPGARPGSDGAGGRASARGAQQDSTARWWASGRGGRQAPWSGRPAEAWSRRAERLGARRCHRGLSLLRRSPATGTVRAVDPLEAVHDEVVACRRCPAPGGLARAGRPRRSGRPTATRSTGASACPASAIRRRRWWSSGWRPRPTARTGPAGCSPATAPATSSSPRCTAPATRTSPTATGRDDGLVLRGACITSPVRCAPPANKPTPDERDACRPFLQRELALLDRARVFLVLGPSATPPAAAEPRRRRRPAFGHGVEVALADERTLLCSLPREPAEHLHRPAHTGHVRRRPASGPGPRRMKPAPVRRQDGREPVAWHAMNRRPTGPRRLVALALFTLLVAACAQSGEPTAFGQQLGRVGDELAAATRRCRRRHADAAPATELPRRLRHRRVTRIEGVSDAERGPAVSAPTTPSSGFYLDSAREQRRRRRHRRGHRARRVRGLSAPSVDDLEDGVTPLPADIQTLVDDCFS